MDRRGFLKVGLGTATLALLDRAGPAQAAPGEQRLRLRQLGLVIGELEPGPLNAITDVQGVKVGHVTLIEGEGPLVKGKGPVRTGVTAILAHHEIARQPVFAADFTLNGNGELTGVGPIRRTGLLGGPVLFTNTSSVGAVYDGAMGWMLAQNPALFASGLHPEPVVGETWADFLHDTVGRHVRAEHAMAAIQSAHGGPVPEGCVGGGTGMRAFGFKAGIGTSSRQVPCGERTYAVGVLVQANFGSRAQLRIDGVPVGREIPELTPERGQAQKSKSMLAVVATSAPLLPVQLQRLCKRVSLGMARTGAISTHGSGDLVLAFSTGQRWEEKAQRAEMLSDRWISSLFQGVVEATEEAILNSLTMAHTMVGRDDNTIHALPLDRLVEVLRAHGRLK
jgi:D-aminopeptidase